MKITLTINGEQKVFNDRVPLSSLVDEDDKTIIAAKVNNRIRELSYEVYFDAEIEFLTTKDYDAVKIYETSLRYLVAMAMDRLYPGVEIHFSYSISRSIYMEILDKNIIVDEKLVLKLVKELDSLIDRNLPLHGNC